MKEFYTRYFGCTAGPEYVNEAKQFKSCFLDFGRGAKLELIKSGITCADYSRAAKDNTGLVHFAISAGGRELVDQLTAKLKNDGYIVVSAPRTTGDGYYESTVLDPENNLIEITL